MSEAVSGDMRAIITTCAALMATNVFAQSVDRSGSYLCTLTNAVGFKLDLKTQKWVEQTHEVDNNQTAIKIKSLGDSGMNGHTLYEVSVRQLEFDPAYVPCRVGSGEGVLEFKGKLDCDLPMERISLNIETLRFASYSVGTYTHPAESNNFGPTATIGTCQKID